MEHIKTTEELMEYVVELSLQVALNTRNLQTVINAHNGLVRRLTKKEGEDNEAD